jgi:hypothetical protein
MPTHSLPKALLPAAIVGAAGIHLLVAVVLSRWPLHGVRQDSGPSLFLEFRMPPPLEGSCPIIVMAEPAGRDSANGADMPKPAPDPLAKSSSDNFAGDILKELAEERERLRVEIAQMKQAAGAIPLPAMPIPKPAVEHQSDSSAGRAGAGTVRRLDLSGFPQQVVDDIMLRYKLRVTQKLLQGGRTTQNFLSSAQSGAGNRFYASSTEFPAGLYQVFELSPAVVARLSEAEDEEIKRRGWNAQQTHVKFVRFGIVRAKDGYDLGVLEMDAEVLE